jgi:voltage-gated potassium channel
VAFGLMIGGIALLGTVTATLASWLVETVAAEKEQAEDLQVTVRRIEEKIDRLVAEKQRDLGDLGQILDQDVNPDHDHSHAVPSSSRSRS